MAHSKDKVLGSRSWKPEPELQSLRAAKPEKLQVWKARRLGSENQRSETAGQCLRKSLTYTHRPGNQSVPRI